LLARYLDYLSEAELAEQGECEREPELGEEQGQELEPGATLDTSALLMCASRQRMVRLQPPPPPPSSTGLRLQLRVCRQLERLHKLRGDKAEVVHFRMRAAALAEVLSERRQQRRRQQR
jgi:hypothetical protein